MGGVRHDVVRRKTSFVLPTSTPAFLADIIVPLQDGISPSDVARFLETPPRAAAFPFIMFLTFRERALT